MPKLWNETIEAHRHDVRQAVLDTAADLVAEHGLLSVTMSRIAEEAGIGRATLYKYFPDVGSILEAWHERQIAAHLELLSRARDSAVTAAERLRSVLETYALVGHESRGHDDSERARLLHRHEHVTEAERQLRSLVRDLMSEAVALGTVRSDVDLDELVAYSLHALAAAGTLPSKPAVRRLVDLTMAGLRPPA